MQISACFVAGYSSIEEFVQEFLMPQMRAHLLIIVTTFCKYAKPGSPFTIQHTQTRPTDNKGCCMLLFQDSLSTPSWGRLAIGDSRRGRNTPRTCQRSAWRCLEYDMLPVTLFFSHVWLTSCDPFILFPSALLRFHHKVSASPAEASRGQQTMFLSWKQTNWYQSWWSRRSFCKLHKSCVCVYSMPPVLPLYVLGTWWSWSTVCCCDCLSFRVGGVHALHH